MKNRFIILIIATLLLLVGCTTQPTETESTINEPTDQTMIYLYGEEHGVQKIIEKEYELWNDYYTNDGMRHLFIELPYYTGELLNEYMKSDNDDILNHIYADWNGTAAHNEYNYEFYKKIKANCPETIFHGTDVGHQNKSTGKRYKEQLEERGLTDSDEYELTLEAIEQGEMYYANNDSVYRENTMVSNFIREYDKLKGEKIMGIYGSAHTDLDGTDYYTHKVKCMANQLCDYYKDIIYSYDLSILTRAIAPRSIEKVTVNGKTYDASYFGQMNLKGVLDGYEYRDFYKLENAYEDLSGSKKLGDFLPYDNFPMMIEEKQIFVVVYKKTDGSFEKMCYIADGDVFQGQPTTTQIRVKEIITPKN